MRSQLLSARAAALFASELPTGSRPALSVVGAAIASSVHACGGTRGCVAMMAAAYGDYPETSAPRMRWALSVASMMAPGATRPEPDRELIAA
ncbi:hypothetical protein ACFQS1_17260 [Paractinoplanes rhizophilus]|uniref:Uncharacterized protein n=1 Tax=Paractinoplanes rhizophilus TaxID=1416877 RepID=A0ABW2HRJ5_9ACTN